uniref:Putative secreted peptide n=1 Tax=Anopheles braziliensis TaxID=58242 RepID=A0A2M3ZPJ6_9DIPT
MLLRFTRAPMGPMVVVVVVVVVRLLPLLPLPPRVSARSVVVPVTHRHDRSPKWRPKRPRSKRRKPIKHPVRMKSHWSSGRNQLA